MSSSEASDRILIRDLPRRVGQRVTVQGRLLGGRSHGGVGFLDLVDRSGRVQLVGNTAVSVPAVQSVIACSGVVIEQGRAPGGVEVQIDSLEVMSEPCEELVFNPASLPSPCRPGGPSMDTLFDHRELTLRSPLHLAVARVTSEVLAAVDAFLRSRDFVEIKTPKIVVAGAEGGAGMFEVRYFERAAFLAQSPQLFKQTMASTPLERVFEVGPVFRAEKHATGRHLNEFVGLDAEMAFPQGLDEIMGVACDLVKAAVERVASSCAKELAALGTTLPKLEGTVPVLDLEEAKTIATGKKPSRANPAEDLTPEDERAVCEWAAREHDCDAVLVHSFPLRSRPFYTLPSARRGRSESFDLLLRGLELSSGGLREHRIEVLEDALERRGIEPDSMASYLRVFRSACPPHGGFGIGLERLVQKLLELPNVRYASLFPRDRARLEP